MIFEGEKHVMLMGQKTQYGVNNTVVAGALYLANGGSNVIAGRIAGRESTSAHAATCTNRSVLR